MKPGFVICRHSDEDVMDGGERRGSASTITVQMRLTEKVIIGFAELALSSLAVEIHSTPR